jgi:hypothetical protein
MFKYHYHVCSLLFQHPRNQFFLIKSHSDNNDINVKSRLIIFPLSHYWDIIVTIIIIIALVLLAPYCWYHPIIPLSPHHPMSMIIDIIMNQKSRIMKTIINNHVSWVHYNYISLFPMWKMSGLEELSIVIIIYWNTMGKGDLYHTI